LERKLPSFKFLNKSGNFATVKLCIHKETGDSYALKIIEKKKFLMSNATRREDALMDEVRILQRLQHPNVSCCFLLYNRGRLLASTKFLIRKQPFTLYLSCLSPPFSKLLTLFSVTGGELFDKIIDHGSFTEERSRNYFKQMLEATNYLHQQDIAHRDLKVLYFPKRTRVTC
jgi:serine/threonine protein kinase